MKGYKNQLNEFYIGRWSHKEAPLLPGATIQVAVTQDKRFPESFPVIHKEHYDQLWDYTKTLERMYANLLRDHLKAVNEKFDKPRDLAASVGFFSEQFGHE